MVLSLLAWEQDAARILLLNEGLALRAAQRWQYICPASWGADNVTLAALLGEDTVVVGAHDGLFSMDRSGAVMPHPDPNAAGRVIGFASAGGGLYALRASDIGAEVLRVERDRVQVVFSDTQPWNAIAGSAAGLHIVRLEGGDRIEHRELSLSGQSGASVWVAAPEPLVSLAARVTQGQLYVTAVAFTGLLLGQISEGAWTTLCRGSNSLSGPTDSGGTLLVSVDGSLRTLDNACAETLATPEPVGCVKEDEGRNYACTKSGASTLEGPGLGTQLFQLRELGPPDVSMLPPPTQVMCCQQWSRYQLDILAYGLITETTLCESPGAMNTAGASGGAGAGGATAGTDGSAAGPAVEDADDSSSDQGGCRVSTGVGSGWFSLLGAWVGLYAAAQLRSRRTARALR